MCECYRGMAGGVRAMVVGKTAIYSQGNKYQSTVLRITLHRRTEIVIVQPVWLG
jgi:hypothetical protein